MRVMCIDMDAYPPDVEGAGNVKICNGESYEVVEIFSEEGYTWYELSIDIGFGYWEKCFIPLSSIDETTFERNYNKELV